MHLVCSKKAHSIHLNKDGNNNDHVFFLPKIGEKHDYFSFRKNKMVFRMYSFIISKKEKREMMRKYQSIVCTKCGVV
jgi:hypothetical protein